MRSEIPPVRDVIRRGFCVVMKIEGGKKSMPATLTSTIPNIGLAEAQQEGVVRILNSTLSDLHVLYIKTRNYHWNVVGPQFRDLHKLFEDQYKQIAEDIDEVAERCRSMGGTALGTMTEYLRYSKLKEHSSEHLDAREMIENLVRDHETVIRSLRADVDRCEKEYHDRGTADFLSVQMQEHEKTAWMLRSFIEGKSV
jgi:starvation-inducible DNA-binding protein